MHVVYGLAVEATAKLAFARRPGGVRSALAEHRARGVEREERCRTHAVWVTMDHGFQVVGGKGRYT